MINVITMGEKVYYSNCLTICQILSFYVTLIFLTQDNMGRRISKRYSYSFYPIQKTLHGHSLVITNVEFGLLYFTTFTLLVEHLSQIVLQLDTNQNGRSMAHF